MGEPTERIMGTNPQAEGTFECPCCGDDEATPAFGRKCCTACEADELERRRDNGECDDSPALPELQP